MSKKGKKKLKSNQFEKMVLQCAGNPERVGTKKKLG